MVHNCSSTVKIVQIIKEKVSKLQSSKMKSYAPLLLRFYFFFITPERYCSALRCNPWYLVCSHRLQRWKVEPGVDLLLREGLALKSGVGQTHREDILKFLFPSLTCATLALLPPTRKQLASVIRRRTFFIHFISLILFVCLFSPPSWLKSCVLLSCRC